MPWTVARAGRGGRLALTGPPARPQTSEISSRPRPRRPGRPLRTCPPARRATYATTPSHQRRHTEGRQKVRGSGPPLALACLDDRGGRREHDEQRRRRHGYPHGGSLPRPCSAHATALRDEALACPSRARPEGGAAGSRGLPRTSDVQAAPNHVTWSGAVHMRWGGMRNHGDTLPRRFSRGCWGKRPPPVADLLVLLVPLPGPSPPPAVHTWSTGSAQSPEKPQK